MNEQSVGFEHEIEFRNNIDIMAASLIIMYSLDGPIMKSLENLLY